MNQTISHVGPINDGFVNSIQNIIFSAAEPISCLTLQISSSGGSVISGITAYNFLKSLPCSVHTHNLGEVSSAAILPYLAGTIRTSEEISKFMFHPVEISFNGSLPYHKVEEILSNISADISNYGDIIERELPLLSKLDSIEELLKHRSRIITPSEALSIGLITR